MLSSTTSHSGKVEGAPLLAANLESLLFPLWCHRCFRNILVSLISLWRDTMTISYIRYHLIGAHSLRSPVCHHHGRKLGNIQVEVALEKLRATSWASGQETLGLGWASETSKPTPRDTQPPTRHQLLILSGSASPWWLGIWIYDPMGGILIQVTLMEYGTSRRARGVGHVPSTLLHSPSHTEQEVGLVLGPCSPRTNPLNPLLGYF